MQASVEMLCPASAIADKKLSREDLMRSAPSDPRLKGDSKFVEETGKIVSAAWLRQLRECVTFELLF